MEETKRKFENCVGSVKAQVCIMWESWASQEGLLEEWGLNGVLTDEEYLLEAGIMGLMRESAHAASQLSLCSLRV